MDFTLLGPVTARLEGRPVPLGPPKQRLLLAVLLLEPGRIVPVDRLYELLWSDELPRSARTAVQVLVSRLRSALSAVHADEYGVRLLTREPGYLLETCPQRVDLHRFQALVDQAGGSDSTARRAELLRRALAEWQGPPLADVADQTVRDRLCVGLTEQYWRTLEDRIDADLRLGRHAELLAELRGRVAEQPLRQRLVGQLMLALYRNGQQADALRVFAHLRERLAEELGLDPVPELRTLHEAVLRADPDPVTAGWAPPGPAQLPADPVGFVGRERELARLDELLDTPDASRTVVVSGVAGVGKTALALRWAHTAAGRFPDGALHADLRGYRSGERVDPGAVLDRFLRALGVPGPSVPTDPAARVGLYRSVLADRRVLILLDNASSAAQVRPLLPAAPGCAALVTSRDRLGGLVARDGAHPLGLDLLDTDSARDLLRTALGDEHRIRPPVVNDLVRLCDRLPLALRIAAGRLAVDPGCSPESLVADLTCAEHRLAALRLDDDASVAEAFAGSYRALSAPAARLFRLLCLVPGTGVSSHAAAALSGLPRVRTRALLSELTVANLVLATDTDRFTMHDLLRVYARDRLTSEEPPAEQQAALYRLAVAYLDTLATADHMLGATWSERYLPPEVPAERVTFCSRGEAMRWLDAERELLVDLVRCCREHGWHGLCWRLAFFLFHYQELRGRYDEWVSIERIGLAAAQDDGDPYGVAGLHRALGMTLGIASSHLSLPNEEAFRHLRQALRRHEASGEKLEQAHDQLDLGLAHFHAGDYALACRHCRIGLELFRAAGDRTGEIAALNNLGISQGAGGDPGEAAETFRTAVALAERTGITRTVHMLWGNLAEALMLLGDRAQARELATRSRQLGRMAGDISGEAEALLTLSDCLPPDEARSALQEALRLYRSIGSSAADRIRARLQRSA